MEVAIDAAGQACRIEACGGVRKDAQAKVVARGRSGLSLISRDREGNVVFLHSDWNGKADHGQAHKLQWPHENVAAVATDACQGGVFVQLSQRGQLRSSTLDGSSVYAIRSIPQYLLRPNPRSTSNSMSSPAQFGCSTQHTLSCSPGGRMMCVQVESWQQPLVWIGASWDDARGAWCKLPQSCSQQHAGLSLVSTKYFPRSRLRAKRYVLATYSTLHGSASAAGGSHWGAPLEDSQAGASERAISQSASGQDPDPPIGSIHRGVKSSRQLIDVPLCGPSFGGFPSGEDQSSARGMNLEAVDRHAASRSGSRDGWHRGSVYGNVMPFDDNNDGIDASMTGRSGTVDAGEVQGEGEVIAGTRTAPWTTDPDGIDCIAFLHIGTRSIDPELRRDTSHSAPVAARTGIAEKGRGWHELVYRITVVGIPECVRHGGEGDKCVLVSLNGSETFQAPIRSVSSEFSLDGGVLCIGVHASKDKTDSGQDSSYSSMAGYPRELKSYAAPRSRRRSDQGRGYFAEAPATGSGEPAGSSRASVTVSTHPSVGPYAGSASQTSRNGTQDHALVIRKLDRPDHVCLRMNDLARATAGSRPEKKGQSASRHVGSPASIEFAASGRVILALTSTGHLLCCTATGLPLRTVAAPSLLRSLSAATGTRQGGSADPRDRRVSWAPAQSSPFLLDLGGTSSEDAVGPMALAFTGHLGTQLTAVVGRTMFQLRLPPSLAATVALPDPHLPLSASHAPEPGHSALPVGASSAAEGYRPQYQTPASRLSDQQLLLEPVEASQRELHARLASDPTAQEFKPIGAASPSRGFTDALQDNTQARNATEAGSTTGEREQLDWAARRAVEDSTRAEGALPPVHRADTQTLTFLAVMAGVVRGEAPEEAEGLRAAPQDGTEEAAMGIVGAPPGAAGFIHAMQQMHECRQSDAAWSLLGAGENALAQLEDCLLDAVRSHVAGSAEDSATDAVVAAFRIAINASGCRHLLLPHYTLRSMAFALTDEGLLQSTVAIESARLRQGLRGVGESEVSSDARPFGGIGSVWRATRATTLAHASRIGRTLLAMDSWTHRLFVEVADIRRGQLPRDGALPAAAATDATHAEGRPSLQDAGRIDAAIALLRLVELATRRGGMVRQAVLMAASGRADAFTEDEDESKSGQPLAFPLAWLRLGRLVAHTALDAAADSRSREAAYRLSAAAAAILALLRRKMGREDWHLVSRAGVLQGKWGQVLVRTTKQNSLTERPSSQSDRDTGALLPSNGLHTPAGALGHSWIPPRRSRLGQAVYHLYEGHVAWTSGTAVGAKSMYLKAGVLGLPSRASVCLLQGDWAGALACAASAWPLCCLQESHGTDPANGAQGAAPGWDTQKTTDMPLSTAESAAAGVAARQCCAIVGAAVCKVFVGNSFGEASSGPSRADGSNNGKGKYQDGIMHVVLPHEAPCLDPPSIAGVMTGVAGRPVRHSDVVRFATIERETAERGVLAVPEVTPALGVELLLGARCSTVATYAAMFAGARVSAVPQHDVQSDERAYIAYLSIGQAQAGVGYDFDSGSGVMPATWKLQLDGRHVDVDSLVPSVGIALQHASATIAIAKYFRPRLPKAAMQAAFTARLKQLVQQGNRSDVFAILSVAGACVGRRDHDLRMDVLREAVDEAERAMQSLAPYSYDVMLAVEAAGCLVAGTPFLLEAGGFSSYHARLQAKNDAQADCGRILYAVDASLSQAAGEIATSSEGDTLAATSHWLRLFAVAACGRSRARHRNRAACSAGNYAAGSLAVALDAAMREIIAAARRRGCSVDPKYLSTTSTILRALARGGESQSMDYQRIAAFRRLCVALDVLFVCARSIGTRGKHVFEGLISAMTLAKHPSPRDSGNAAASSSGSELQVLGPPTEPEWVSRLERQQIMGCAGRLLGLIARSVSHGRLAAVYAILSIDGTQEGKDMNAIIRAAAAVLRARGGSVRSKQAARFVITESIRACSRVARAQAREQGGISSNVLTFSRALAYALAACGLPAAACFLAAAVADPDADLQIESPHAWVLAVASAASSQSTWAQSYPGAAAAEYGTAAAFAPRLDELHRQARADATGTLDSRSMESTDAGIVGLVCPPASLLQLRSPGGADHEHASVRNSPGSSQTTAPRDLAKSSWILLMWSMARMNRFGYELSERELEAVLGNPEAARSLAPFVPCGLAHDVATTACSRLYEGILFHPWWESDANPAVRKSRQRRSSSSSSTGSASSPGRSSSGRSGMRSSMPAPTGAPVKGFGLGAASASSPRSVLPDVPEDIEGEAHGVDADTGEPVPLAERGPSPSSGRPVREVVRDLVAGRRNEREGALRDGAGRAMEPRKAYARGEPQAARHRLEGDDNFDLDSATERIARKRARDRAAAEAAAKRHAMHVLAPTTMAYDVDEMADVIASLGGGQGDGDGEDDAVATAGSEHPALSADAPKQLRTVASWLGAPYLDVDSSDIRAGLSTEEAKDIELATLQYHETMTAAGRLADGAAPGTELEADGMRPSSGADAARHDLGTSSSEKTSLEAIRKLQQEHESWGKTLEDRLSVAGADGGHVSGEEDDEDDLKLVPRQKKGNLAASSRTGFAAESCAEASASIEPLPRAALAKSPAESLSAEQAAQIASDSGDHFALKSSEEVQLPTEETAGAKETTSLSPALGKSPDYSAMLLLDSDLVSAPPTTSPGSSSFKAQRECRVKSVGFSVDHNSESAADVPPVPPAARQVADAQPEQAQPTEGAATSPRTVLDLSASMPGCDGRRDELETVSQRQETETAMQTDPLDSSQDYTGGDGFDPVPTRQLPISSIEPGTSREALRESLAHGRSAASFRDSGAHGQTQHLRSLQERIQRGQQLLRGKKPTAGSTNAHVPPHDSRASSRSRIRTEREAPSKIAGPLSATLAASSKLAAEVRTAAQQHPGAIVDGWKVAPLQTMPAAARRALPQARKHSGADRRRSLVDVDTTDSSTQSGTTPGRTRVTRPFHRGTSAPSTFRALNPSTGQERESLGRAAAASHQPDSRAGDGAGGALGSLRLLRMPVPQELRGDARRQDGSSVSKLAGASTVPAADEHEAVFTASETQLRTAGSRGVQGEKRGVSVRISAEGLPISSTVPYALYHFSSPRQGHRPSASVGSAGLVSPAGVGPGAAGGWIGTPVAGPSEDSNGAVDDSDVLLLGDILDESELDRMTVPASPRLSGAPSGTGGGQSHVHPGEYGARSIPTDAGKPEAQSRRSHSRIAPSILGPAVPSAIAREPDHTVSRGTAQCYSDNDPVPSPELRHYLRSRDTQMGTPTAALEAAEREEAVRQRLREVRGELDGMAGRVSRIEDQERGMLRRLDEYPSSAGVHRNAVSGKEQEVGDNDRKSRVRDVLQRAGGLGMDVDAEIGLVSAARGSGGGASDRAGIAAAGRRRMQSYGSTGAAGKPKEPEEWERDLQQAKDLMRALEQIQGGRTVRASRRRDASPDDHRRESTPVSGINATAKPAFDLGSSGTNAARSRAFEPAGAEPTAAAEVPRVSIDGLKP